MSASSRRVRHVILGTAGHIDHGKTSLVQRLTGTWADKLPEERERGMTIELGYAAFQLDDGTEAGLIDVPGHESFIHTMVAGASVMDLAVLVVAADDGPMPQTREHMEILDVLGVERLVVALTKVDLVDEETALFAEEMVREMVDATGMRGAPIVPVSSATGQGMDALRAALVGALPGAIERKDDGRVFRMPVLRSFLVPGRGAVVTGVPISGRIEVGEAVEVLPPAWKGRVRGAQVHGADAEAAGAGHRTALALSDVAVERLKRGMVIVSAGIIQPARRLAVEVRVLAGARKPISHGERVRLHIGAARVIAQVHVPLRKPIEPGQSGIVELVPSTPVVALPGDRCVVREENASSTLGGGVVIEHLDRPLPRRREGLIAQLRERVPTLGKASALVDHAIQVAGEASIAPEEISARTGIRPQGLPGIFASLRSKGRIQPLGRSGRLIANEAFAKIRTRLEETIVRLHERDTAQASLPISAVRSSMGRTASIVFDSALADLVDAGQLIRTGDGGVKHVDHSDELPPQDRALCERLEARLEQAKGQPPAIEELAADEGLSLPALQRALRLLGSRERAFQAGDWWFASTWVEQAQSTLRRFAAEHEGFTPGDARTLLGTTRKWIIPFLEALDRAGFSRRVGDRRVVKG